MNTTERNQLIRNIFASQVSFVEIKEKAEILQANLSRTKEQDDELASYLKQLTHDKAVIGRWRQVLAADGVVNLPTAARDVVMVALEKQQQDEITRINNLKTIAAVRFVLGEITKEDNDREQTELTERLAPINKRLVIIAALKNEATDFWSRQ